MSFTRPLPFETLSIFSSCVITISLSFVKWTSSSIPSHPISMAFSKAVIVFSGYFPLKPLWAKFLHFIIIKRLRFFDVFTLSQIKDMGKFLDLVCGILYNCSYLGMKNRREL